jgi:4-amino-4-deoxy-L-arabinose transferase-like glycosyltransferase
MSSFQETQAAVAGSANQTLPRPRVRARAFALRLPRPELAGLIVLAGTLNLWALSRNGWANDYYSAAVRSMSSSWHNFLFGSLDSSGVMTVDKPPLALWIQSLSVRIFGYHSLSILVPQALIGIAPVVLVYDLVRRRFGRLGGFVAGLALALTPITVAISRHNNPDALLVLCCVAALWCTVRALEAAPARAQTRWLVFAGVAVGLGFETKMAVALMVVPGIIAAWLWIAPADGNPTHPRLHALRQLFAGGVAMVLVGGAWPLLVELTPVADRPWISGTSDNKIISLISEYNGVGRIDGQTGGPGGAGGRGGSVFGGSAGPLRLLNSALGGQAGWLLGFALVSGVGILVASRLRRADPRSGWLIAVGGALLVTGVVFSSAKGIFHPYYVSLLAPFIAMLTGAGAAQLLKGGLNARIVGPLAVVAGVATELAVLGQYPGELTWLAPILIAVGVLAALALAAFAERRVRFAALGAVLAALLIAPGAWAVDTLGHATSGTFPAGGPEAAANGGPGGFGGGPGGRGGFPGGRGGFAGRRPGASGVGGVQLFGSVATTSQSGSATRQEATAGAGGQAGSAPTGASTGAGVPSGATAGGSTGTGAGTGLPNRPAGGAGFAAGGAGGRGGAGFGGDEASLTEALTYIDAHGGGTLAVESQSSAATAIIEKDANVAGIGGFSGRESTVSISWLANEVAAGKIRWVLGGEESGRGLPGDTRKGSSVAIAAAAKVCRKVTLPSTTSTVSGTSGASGTGAGVGGSASALFGTRTGATTGSTATLYDCQGRAAALRTQESGR